MLEDDIAAFQAHGFVRLPGLVSPDELAVLREQTNALLEEAAPGARDSWFAPGPATGEPVLRRVDYVVDKLPACAALLAHPGILAAVQAIQGPAFIPTWDSMVVKMPGEGIEVEWHRDAGTAQVGDVPIFNVDIYLDDADEKTALWAVPGSHRWDDETAAAEVERRRHGGFVTDGATQIPMRAGDVLLHDILLVHGSPPSEGNRLRRVVYYEFRPITTELERGPHTPEYIPLKQRVLLACLRDRSGAGYATNERAFSYDPPSPFDTVAVTVDDEPLPTYRYPHHRYWRGEA